MLEKEEEGEENLIRNLKKIDFKEASYMIGIARNSVNEQNLKNARNKILNMIELIFYMYTYYIMHCNKRAMCIYIHKYVLLCVVFNLNKYSLIIRINQFLEHPSPPINLDNRRSALIHFSKL